MGKIKVFLKKALEKKGLKLFGVIPYVALLSTFTVAQVTETLDSEVISGKENLHRRILNTLVGAMTPHEALTYFKEGSLIITPGDREDIILASLLKIFAIQVHKEFVLILQMLDQLLSKYILCQY